MFLSVPVLAVLFLPGGKTFKFPSSLCFFMHWVMFGDWCFSRFWYWCQCVYLLCQHGPRAAAAGSVWWWKPRILPSRLVLGLFCPATAPAWCGPGTDWRTVSGWCTGIWFGAPQSILWNGSWTCPLGPVRGSTMVSTRVAFPSQTPLSMTATSPWSSTVRRPYFHLHHADWRLSFTILINCCLDACFAFFCCSQMSYLLTKVFIPVICTITIARFTSPFKSSSTSLNQVRSPSHQYTTQILYSR